MCMVDWGEGWKVFRSGWPTSRKEYACCECRRTIEVGERYYRATGLGNGIDYWDTFTMCAHCNYAAQWLMSECNGYLFHGVLEDLEEHWNEELIRSLDLGRRIVWMRRKWRTKSGDLMAVPS